MAIAIKILDEKNKKNAARVAKAIEQSLRPAGLLVEAVSRRVLTVKAPLSLLQKEASREELMVLSTAPDSISGEPRLLPFDESRAGEFQDFDPCDSLRMTAELALRCPRHPSAPALGHEDGTAVLGKDGLLLELEHEGAVKVTPLHDTDEAQAIMWRSISLEPLEADEDAIFRYFGAEVGYYFAWLNFQLRWLAVPAGLGVLLYVARLWEGIDVDRDDNSAAFSVAMVLWGFCFVAFWRRQAASLACRYGTLHDDDELIEHPNRHFHGLKGRSPVTGEEELQYPAWKRVLFHYPVSALASAAMLAVAAGVIALSLNAQGYVHEDSFLFVPGLAHLAAEGAIFDKNAMLPSLLPVILHVAVVAGLNAAYRRVAVELTRWENHRFERDEEQSLIIKRFLFEMTDCFAPLAYLAFYERDIDLLRAELVSLFSVDSVRRIAVEVMLPLTTHLWWRLTTSRQSSKTTKTMTKGGDDVVHPAVEQSEREEAELFDDFLEMVVQMGYVLLFASAFPLAAPLALLCLLVEARSDVVKLVVVTARPLPRRVRGIGSWSTIVEATVWAAAATNVFIMGLTTEQLMSIAPRLFVDEGETHAAKIGAIELMLVLEHVLLLCGVIIGLAVPTTPEDVAIDQRRRRHDSKLALIQALRTSSTNKTDKQD